MADHCMKQRVQNCPVSFSPYFDAAIADTPIPPAIPAAIAQPIALRFDAGACCPAGSRAIAAGRGDTAPANIGAGVDRFIDPGD
jgi:hypothetical protein